MQNKGKAWTDMSTGERKAVLIGWLAVLAIGAYFFWPSKSIEPLANGPQNENPALLPAAVTFTKASPEAMAIANQYFADVEQAMELGLNSLKSKSLKSMGDHSRRFSALADQGKALFGATIADHFGQCGIAGNFARAWWQAQVGAALKGGIESTPGEVQSNLSIYESRRVDCLNTIAEGLRGNS
ncbi:hypothetical protein SAMN05216248_10453 [Pseudomonas simiae]|uniref:hypothetical protein n=1 Tax=Pseudomonas simiae TaxID=321846 RepID=UPI0008F22F74|nr:hypothetical protein [Pseudomonas simiae]SFB28309.1 hypothetical protein SAMN05216248_10453 [Pseudomonas simiae]